MFVSCLTWIPVCLFTCLHLYLSTALSTSAALLWLSHSLYIHPWCLYCICLSVNLFAFFIVSSFCLIFLNVPFMFPYFLTLWIHCQSFSLCVIFCLSLFWLVFLHPLIGEVNLSITNMESFLPPCGHVCLADMFINGCWGEVLGVTFGLPRSLRLLVFIVYVSSTQNL